MAHHRQLPPAPLCSPCRLGPARGQQQDRLPGTSRAFLQVFRPCLSCSSSRRQWPRRSPYQPKHHDAVCRPQPVQPVLLAYRCRIQCSGRPWLDLFAFWVLCRWKLITWRTARSFHQLDESATRLDEPPQRLEELAHGPIASGLSSLHASKRHEQQLCEPEHSPARPASPERLPRRPACRRAWKPSSATDASQLRPKRQRQSSTPILIALAWSFYFSYFGAFLTNTFATNSIRKVFGSLISSMKKTGDSWRQ